MKHILALLLTTVAAMSASVQVTWNPHPDGTNIVRFNVYVTDPNGAIDITSVTLPPATLTNLTPGLTYKIEATAVNKAGLESDFSAPPLLYTPSLLSVPGPVTSGGFLFSGVGKFSAQFSWPAATGSNVLGYRVKWGPTTNKLNTLNLTSPIATISALTNGVNYYMSVETLDKFGNKSDPSADYTFRNDFAILQNVRTTLQTFTSPSQVP
jgi:hypothetical protein